jgi:hypothetical protein
MVSLGTAGYYRVCNIRSALCRCRYQHARCNQFLLLCSASSGAVHAVYPCRDNHQKPLDCPPLHSICASLGCCFQPFALLHGQAGILGHCCFIALPKLTACELATSAITMATSGYTLTAHITSCHRLQSRDPALVHDQCCQPDNFLGRYYWPRVVLWWMLVYTAEHLAKVLAAHAAAGINGCVLTILSHSVMAVAT